MITPERLRELLNYDPATGLFHWRVTLRNGRGGAGALAGNRSSRLRQEYIIISIDGVTYKAHRLAWLYVHGCWPVGEVDHKNGQKDDNCLSNLRSASHQQNCANRKANDGCAYKGVIYDVERKKWRATVRKKIIGRFPTAEEAHAAYVAAASALYGEFARPR